MKGGGGGEKGRQTARVKENKSEEGQSEREREREMTPERTTWRRTLRNFVSCGKTKSVKDRDSVVILQASWLCKVCVTQRVSLLGQTHSSELPSSPTHLTMKL